MLSLFILKSTTTIVRTYKTNTTQTQIEPSYDSIHHLCILFIYSLFSFFLYSPLCWKEGTGIRDGVEEQVQQFCECECQEGPTSEYSAAKLSIGHPGRTGGKEVLRCRIEANGRATQKTIWRTTASRNQETQGMCCYACCVCEKSYHEIPSWSSHTFFPPIRMKWW